MHKLQAHNKATIIGGKQQVQKWTTRLDAQVMMTTIFDKEPPLNSKLWTWSCVKNLTKNRFVAQLLLNFKVP